MSHENVEVVRAVYECWRQGDFRATANKVAPDFEWKQVHGVVEPGSHVGAGASRALRSIFEVYEDLRVEAEEYVDAGDTIVVVARAHGTARGSGPPGRASRRRMGGRLLALDRDAIHLDPGSLGERSPRHRLGSLVHGQPDAAVRCHSARRARTWPGRRDQHHLRLPTLRLPTGNRPSNRLPP